MIYSGMEHKYSEALRRVAPHLAQHTCGREMLKAIAYHERTCEGRDGWDTAEAVYYVASMWYTGQGSALYAAMCATEFEPGPLWYSPAEGSGAEMLADTLDFIIREAEAPKEGN